MKIDCKTSQRPERGNLLSVLGGSLVVGVALLASGLLAQNNDNGGILPAASGGTAANASSHDTTLAIAGQMEGNATDSFLPALRVGAEGYTSVGTAFGVSAEDAEFQTAGSLFVQSIPSGDLLLQGNGTLNPEIGLELMMHAATAASGRAAVLIGSSATQPLESLLSGAVAPFAMMPLGDLPSLDLTVFAHQLQKHHDPNAPFRATIVFLSWDPMGGLHLAAASGVTGGEIELAFK